jgi:hypothetical protein
MDGFIEHAQSTSPLFTSHRERASGKARALIWTWSQPLEIQSLICPDILPNHIQTVFDVGREQVILFGSL